MVSQKIFMKVAKYKSEWSIHMGAIRFEKPPHREIYFEGHYYGFMTLVRFGKENLFLKKIEQARKEKPMGVYDILPAGQQVKCWWCEGRQVKIGDEVLAVRGLESYSVALEEGGFANVFKNVLISVIEVAMMPDVVDKWGAEVNDEK